MECQRGFIEKLIEQIRIEDNHKNNNGSLYNMFSSSLFDVDLLIYYIDKKEEVGVLDTLINLMHKKFLNKSFFYLPQLCILLTYKIHYETLENYILDKCINQMKFSLKINWLIDSYLQNTNDPKITKLYDRLLQKIEVTLVNANRSKMNRISHHQKELHTRSSVIFDQSIDKELRLKYFEICVKFYENLKAMCEKLKSFPKEIDRPNNRNVIMRNYLFVYNSNIISMREEMQNQFGAEYSKTVIKNFFKGMILPFDDFNSTMDEHNSIIVRMIPEYSFCFSTKARVPVKICAECVRANECLQWDDLFKDDGNKIKKSIDTGSANVDVNIISTETEDFLIEDNLDEKQENCKIKYNKTLDEFMKEIKLREEKKLTSASNCHSSMENKIEKDIEANEDFSVTDFNPEVTNPFGRKWTDVCKEIRKTSPYRNFESYSIKNFIAKADDDLRQELMAMQLISRFNDIFTKAEIPLKIRPYEILITSSSSGLIEFLPNTNSIDGTKKKLPSYWSLNSFFRNFYSEFFEEAQKNFAESLAAYSLVCYYIQIKDRHNGNILLDLKGNVIHIDFGFILGISPGNLNFESAPFKLTAEYVEILDGLESPIFEYFKSLMFRGMIEAKKNVNTFIKIVEIMTRGTKMPCFENVDVSIVLQKFRERFHETKSENEIKRILDELIYTSYDNFWTNKYDYYQKLTNGIIP